MILISSCSRLCPIHWSQVLNEDVVGAAPTGDVPTTSEWSTILLPTKVRLILETWRYVFLTLTHCLLALCTVLRWPARCRKMCCTRAHDSHPKSGWWFGQNPSRCPKKRGSIHQFNNTLRPEHYFVDRFHLILISFHLSLFPIFQLTVSQHWFR